MSTHSRAAAVCCICLLFLEFVSIDGFSPLLHKIGSFGGHLAIRRHDGCIRQTASARSVKMVDDFDGAKLEADRMDGILELQRQTSYMNRFTTSSYLNKIQYDMAVTQNLEVHNTAQTVVKTKEKWPIISSFEKKMKKLAGNALDLIFASIFYMSGESKSSSKVHEAKGVWHKAIVASEVIRGTLRFFIISLKSIGQNLQLLRRGKTPTGFSADSSVGPNSETKTA
jgi:hypothetical protein